jgi:hypothetical protein
VAFKPYYIHENLKNRNRNCWSEIPLIYLSDHIHISMEFPDSSCTSALPCLHRFMIFRNHAPIHPITCTSSSDQFILLHSPPLRSS